MFLSTRKYIITESVRETLLHPLSRGRSRDAIPTYLYRRANTHVHDTPKVPVDRSASGVPVPDTPNKFLGLYTLTVPPPSPPPSPRRSFLALASPCPLLLRPLPFHLSVANNDVYNNFNHGEYCCTAEVSSYTCCCFCFSFSFSFVFLCVLGQPPREVVVFAKIMAAPEPSMCSAC